jgi:anti-anti-sigma factor
MAMAEGQEHPDELGISMWHSAVCPVIGLRGDLRAATVPAFFAQIARVFAVRPDVVVVDLSQLAFCDFEGVAALLGAHRRARRIGARLVLAGTQGRCAQILHRTGLDQIFRPLPGPATVTAATPGGQAA